MVNWKVFHSLRNEAFRILLDNNNFVHNIEHALRVADNAVAILNALKRTSEKDYYLCRLAAFWHDTGKNDWNAEKVPHQIISAELFAEAAGKADFLEKDKLIVQEMILSHRRRGADCNLPNKYLLKILWDADKLDIINLDRINELFLCYKQGIEIGEFNYSDSVSYWKSILSDSLENKLFYDVSRAIYCKKYPAFYKLVSNLK